MRDEYAFTLLDCPPSLGLLTVNALVAATHLLIPIQSSYFALEGTDDLLETIEKVRQRPNPGLRILIQDLKKKSWENEAPIWRDIAQRLEKPTKNRIAVNLSRIDRYANANDTILVPGKLLAAGAITKPVKVAAYGFSASAVEKIAAAGGQCMSIEALCESNPKGTNVKIMG